jgi:tRNA A37 threonylcarbamoyltransferase TsaD
MFLAEPKHCGDNAAMIAFAAWSEPDQPTDVAPAPSLTVDQA